MYWLMSIGAVVRIAFAMAFLFVVIPALAWPRRKTATRLEWFFWNFGVGIAVITLLGQLLALGNFNSLVTLLFASALIVLFAHSAYLGLPPWTLVQRSSERMFLVFLNVFDGRMSVSRRFRRMVRRGIATVREKTSSLQARWQIAGWLALTTIAAGLRLYRPLASANLGFSDTYVHLYLLKLLEEGQQVDPAWGPYPRAMQFLLMAVHQLTNVDQILLLNFFGVFVGVLMVLAVTDAARRLSGSLIAGLVAGFLFATLVGGPGQYFVLGGIFNAEAAGALRGLPYEAIRAGAFDVVLTAFQRQTSTLPQELAIALLFPAVLFLRDFLRTGERWYLAGFVGSTAAIAASHTGVLAPLALMSALMLAAVALDRTIRPGAPGRVAVAGFAAVFVGSSWALAFFKYPYAGGSAHSIGTNPTLLYYFPFLRSVTGGGEAAAGIAAGDNRIFVALTPLILVCLLLAAGLLVASIRRDERRGDRLWIASTFLVFLLIHLASRIGLPQVIEIQRNTQWLTMTMTILIGVAIVALASLARALPKARVLATAALLLILVGWTSRVPRLSDPLIHDRIVNYSGYGASALAVLRIERTLEPYTWTIVSYGQEFPMVMRRGFHLSAVEFLDQYDPQQDRIPIPTPNIFIIVEKTPHHFQINTWAQRFSRSDLEQRLQTWIHLYQLTHKNMRVFLEDESVCVYQIERTPDERP